MKILTRTAPYAIALVAVATSARAQTDSSRPSPDRERPLEWAWTNGEIGYESVNLRTFTANTETLAVGIVPTTASGPAFGLGAGVRIVFLNLGVRGRVANLSGATSRGSESFQLWTLDAETGIRIPLRRVEPYLTFSVGYAALGGFGSAVQGLNDGFDVSGANARFGVGVDYYVTPHFTLGINATGEALALARKGVSLRNLAEAKRVGSIDEAQARVLEANGSSVGTALMLGGGAGLHF